MRLCGEAGALAGTALLCFPPIGAEELIGARAPEWRADNWLNSPPLELENLRGKAVLVRWWTAPDCSYCAATAAALNEINSGYHRKDLEVVGCSRH